MAKLGGSSRQQRERPFVAAFWNGHVKVSRQAQRRAVCDSLLIGRWKRWAERGEHRCSKIASVRQRARGRVIAADAAGERMNQSDVYVPVAGLKQWTNVCDRWPSAV